MSRILISIYLCLTILFGCGETKTERDVETQESRPSLVLGLIPERNIFKQLDRYEPLATYLSEKIGADVKLKVLTRYGNLIDNFASAGLDGAFFGSFTYTLAHAKLGVEAIARPETVGGVSTYYGLIFVRKDSDIKSVQDMKGKSFVFVDRATTAGYLLPLAFFRAHRIENYKTFFKETYFSGTHEDAIYDVLNKKAEIGAAKNTVFARLAAADSRVKDELVILARSPEVPENGLAVRNDLDHAIRNKLQEALLNMQNESQGIQVLKDLGAMRFIETTDSDYANVYKYAKQIGLDLTTYQYQNE
ncbi:MAG: phosphate/phosphite/phosphonate ABC transporter substrate-binding protein [Deltaproteobacteria bacterium]|nr:phosphate/phosphite/phosphonate ABC transporter substrate-binding protein [Deltaproteobacteria bacterium]